MIIYGTQYYRPPYPNARAWEADLRKIKQCHFNTVKLWAVWSWIERKEGEFYFDDLDRLVDLCETIGLNVVFNTIAEGMPYWVSRTHADARYVTHAGQSIEVSGAANMPSGGSPGVCPDKPAVKALIARFIETVVARYAECEHVIAFDVWNEPHIEPMFDYPEDLFCYCEHSKASFRQWVQAKYGTLDNLNAAWNRAYAEWIDVLPPVRFGTYPDMIDWRLFWVENLGRWLDFRVEAARKVAHGTYVMTHVPFSGYIGGIGEGGLGQHLGDEFILAPKVDKFGLTSFPKWLMQNDYVQHLINIELIAEASADKEFWQSELQAGAGKWEAFGRALALPEEIRLWNWSAIACGAKGVLYWQWKPEPSGMESPGFGLTGLDGDLSGRTVAAADCARRFNEVPGFDRAKRVLPVNGIFVSRYSDLLLHAAHKGEVLYAKGLYGAYRACFNQGVPVRMIHADQLPEAIAGNLTHLYAPVALALSAEEQHLLRQFVEQGGTLIAEACAGFFDEKGVLRENTNFFRDVFGLSRQAVDRVADIVMTWTELPSGLTDHNFIGRQYRQDFTELSPHVKVLATFPDGKPAVCQHRYGKGTALWIGSFPSLAVAYDADLAAEGVITLWLNKHGYADMERLSANDNIFLRLHSDGHETYVVAVNYLNREQQVELRLKSQSGVKSGQSVCFKVNAMNGEIVRLPVLNA
jgi:beta-galactosidase GanA